MKIGIIGSEADGRCKALARFLASQQAESFFVDNHSLEDGVPWSFDGQAFFYKGHNLDQVAAWFLATYPPLLPPAWSDYQQHFLYRDWFVEYMQKREHKSLFLAWLCSLVHQGVPVINPPEHGLGMQLKPLELLLAQRQGLRTPRTLISNDPQAVRAFIEELSGQGQVVFKPSAGGSLCKPVTPEVLQKLALIRSAPVTFQEQVKGQAVRVTAVDGQVVSAVRLLSDHLDYRNDPKYENQQLVYEQVRLPEAVAKGCLELIRSYGLIYSGIDLIETPEGEYVFLEANCSPLYLDIELRANAPITAEICVALLKYANDPAAYQQTIRQGRQQQSLVSYALPFGDDLWT